MNLLAFHNLKKTFILWSILALCWGLGDSVFGQTQNRQRYVGLMLLNLSDEGNHERQLIRMASDYGLNAIYLTIHWDKVYYDSPDKADWSIYDDQIKSVVDRGMSLAIRVHLTRAKGRLKGFWDWEKDGLKDHLKISHMGAFTATTFRYSHEPSANKAADFVKEVTERYKWVHDQGKLLFISASNTPEQEAGYPYENFEPDTDRPKIYPALFDCSEQTTIEYRNWLKKHYGKIERLNHSWGVVFNSFEEVGPHITHWEPRESFQQRYGKDWYRFRHEQLKTYTEKLISAVKSVSPTIRYVSDYGSVMDGGSGLRGTIAFSNLNEKADGVKVNDQIGADHRFSTDVLRSNLPKNAFVGNEVFIADYVTQADADRQVNQCFEHGADMVCFVVSLEKTLERVQGSVRSAVARWKSAPRPDIVYTDSISYSLVRGIDNKSMAELLYGAYSASANKSPGGPRPVKVKIDDDMFVPSYWAMAANKLPYLKVPIPMQIKALGKPFSFDIAKDHFGDVDGYIDRIRIVNLPGWLTFDGVTLKGTGNSLGDTRLEVRATDDEGGEFSAYLTLRIDPTDNPNIPPKLQINLSELVARVNENYSYELPREMFTDDDGTVTRIEVSDLPGWLKFSNGVLSGRPTQLGEYQVTLKAYDNENAFVETYLSLKVKDQSFFNSAPFIAKPIPTLYSPENEFFTFDIPSGTFVDPDGYLTHVQLHAHPTWLSLAFNRIEGLPPGKGEYHFYVRAFDNIGSFTDAPVTLKVEEAALRFTLQKGGGVNDPEVVGLIEKGAVYHVDSIPPLLNIAVDGNYHFDRIRLQLTGPFLHEMRTRRHPYTLFPGNEGFGPAIGRYDLFGEAYTWDDSLLYVTSTYFYISKGTDDDITGDMPEWTAYPVPFSDVMNLKAGDNQEEPYRFTIVTAMGQKLEVPERFVVRTGPLYQINFSNFGLSGGIYVIEATLGGVIRKRIKVAKG